MAVHPEEIELSDETRQRLLKRLQAHTENAEAGSPWEEVKAGILSQ